MSSVTVPAGFYLLLACTSLLFLAAGLLLANASPSELLRHPRSTTKGAVSHYWQSFHANLPLLLIGLGIGGALIPALILENYTQATRLVQHQPVQHEIVGKVQSDQGSVSIFIVPASLPGAIRSIQRGHSQTLNLTVPLVDGVRYQALLVVNGQVVDSIPLIPTAPNSHRLTLARDFVWQSPPSNHN